MMGKKFKKNKNCAQVYESCPVGLKHTLYSYIALALGSQGGQFDPPMLVWLVETGIVVFFEGGVSTTGGMFGKRENLFPE